MATIAFVVLLVVGPLVPIVGRMLYYRKTSAWVEVVGNVSRSYFKLVGDSSSVFVDVRYEYGGALYDKSGLLTDAISVNEIGPRDSISLLVDPENPKRCEIAFVAQGGGDKAVLNLACKLFKLPPRVPSR